MTRKDSEKEAERPHYYSQFWLDVAAGRRVIGAPRPNEENELAEIEPEEPAPIRRTGRVQEEPANTDGRSENIVHPVAEPATEPEESIEPEAEEEPYADEAEDLDLQDVEDSDIPDMDLEPAEEEAEEGEEFFDEEEDEQEEEDEEDVGWGGRGSRKKAKPARPTRPPKKPGRRDTRRGY